MSIPSICTEDYLPSPVLTRRFSPAALVSPYSRTTEMPWCVLSFRPYTILAWTAQFIHLHLDWEAMFYLLNGEHLLDCVPSVWLSPVVSPLLTAFNFSSEKPKSTSLEVPVPGRPLLPSGQTASCHGSYGDPSMTASRTCSETQQCFVLVMEVTITANPVLGSHKVAASNR